MPVFYEDQIRQICEKVKDQLEKVKKDEDIGESLDGYAPVFIPGDHGPTIDVHDHESLGKLLHLGGDFPYKDFKIVVNPDSMDKISPKFGHLSGYLSEHYLVESKLRALGCHVQNKSMTVYRESHAFWCSLALLTSLFQIYRILPSSLFWVRKCCFDTVNSSQFPQSPLTDRFF